MLVENDLAEAIRSLSRENNDMREDNRRLRTLVEEMFTWYRYYITTEVPDIDEPQHPSEFFKDSKYFPGNWVAKTMVDFSQEEIDKRYEALMESFTE